MLDSIRPTSLAAWGIQPPGGRAESDRWHQWDRSSSRRGDSASV